MFTTTSARTFTAARAQGYTELAEALRGRPSWSPATSAGTAWAHASGAWIVSAPRQDDARDGYAPGWRVGHPHHTDGWQPFASLSQAIEYGGTGAGVPSMFAPVMWPDLIPAGVDVSAWLLEAASRFYAPAGATTAERVAAVGDAWVTTLTAHGIAATNPHRTAGTVSTAGRPA